MLTRYARQLWYQLAKADAQHDRVAFHVIAARLRAALR